MNYGVEFFFEGDGYFFCWVLFIVFCCIFIVFKLDCCGIFKDKYFVFCNDFLFINIRLQAWGKVLLGCLFNCRIVGNFIGNVDFFFYCVYRMGMGNFCFGIFVMIVLEECVGFKSQFFWLGMFCYLEFVLNFGLFCLFCLYCVMQVGGMF